MASKLIKYYGGKQFMTDIIIDNFPKDFNIYVEGFGGSASVLFKKERKGIEVYNDLGRNVYSLFKVISDKEKFERLKHRLELTYYHKDIREEFKNNLKRDDISLEDRAYYFFYVSRTSFNGVGGFSRTMLIRRGMCRSTSDYLSSIEMLPEFHDRLSSVLIDNLDIIELIKKYDGDKTFFYLDPPYVKKTRKSSQKYEVEMTDSEHEKLVKTLLNIKGKFLLSGYNNEIYNALSDKYGRIDFKSPNANSSATESLWKNY